MGLLIEKEAIHKECRIKPLSFLQWIFGIKPKCIARMCMHWNFTEQKEAIDAEDILCNRYESHNLGYCGKSAPVEELGMVAGLNNQIAV